MTDIWDAKDSTQAFEAAAGDKALFLRWALHHVLRGQAEGAKDGKLIGSTVTYDICPKPPCPLPELWEALRELVSRRKE